MEKQMELFEDGGLKDEGGMVDEESGNEVPVGGTRKGVRDDIPANISEGEFIFPEDVTRYIGLDKLMQLRQEAKMGLKRMEAMGQMGNSEEATIDDDLPFSMADLIIIGEGPESDEEMNMAEGGLTTASTGSRRTLPQTTTPTAPITPPTNTVAAATRRLTPVPITQTSIPIDFKNLMGEASIEYKEYRNAEGNTVMIPYVGGVAQFPVPDGYTLYTGTDSVEGSNTTAGAIVAATNAATSAARLASGGNDNNIQPSTPTPDPINWSSLSTDELISESAKLTGVGSTIAKGVMAFMGPFGIVGFGLMRYQEKKVAKEIANRIAKGGLTTAQLKRLTETQEKLTPKGFTIIGKIIDFVGGALGVDAATVETAKKNTAKVESTSEVLPATTTAAPMRTQMQVIADATAMVPELGEIGTIKPVSTATMALDLAEEGRAYDQSVEAATSQYRNMLLGKPLPSGLTEESITNNIIEKLGIDALREIQSNIRPDLKNPYDPVPNAALQNVNRELYSSQQDRERMERLKLSEPGSRMTTEEQIEERKRLASAYQRPPAVIDPRSPTTASGFAGDQPPVPAVIDPRSPTTASGFAGDQPPVSAVINPRIPTTASGFAGDQPPVYAPPQYDMFGNKQTNAVARKEADKNLLDSSKDANREVLFDQVEKLLSEGSQRGPLSDVDPNLQLESVTPFAPKLSAVSQYVVPPSPVTNLDLRPTDVGAQTQQAFSTDVYTPPSIIGSPQTKAPAIVDTSVYTPPSSMSLTPTTVDTSVYTPPSSMSLTPTTVDTSVYTPPSSMSLTPPSTPRTFNEEFAAQRKAGAKEFSYDRDGDGIAERYTTQTAEEAAAQSTPTGTNSLFQSAANLFTPRDGKEYVGGVLVDTKTKKPITKTETFKVDKTTSTGATLAKTTSSGSTIIPTGTTIATGTKLNSKSDPVVIVNNKAYNKSKAPTRDKSSVQADINKALKDSGGKWTSELNTLVKERDAAKPAPAPAPKPAATTSSNNSGGDSGGNSGGSDKIVCTEMYRQTQLADWQQAMKIWDVYHKKHLTPQHQVGYHWLFKPYVKGMQNNTALTKLGAFLAMHRTQHLKHVLTKGKAKDDLIGNLWCKFVHPLVYVAGVIKEKIGK